MNGGKLWGNVDPVGFERIEAFMLDSKQISKTLPATTFLLDIPGFYERVNAFDAEATRAAALKCQTR